MMDAVHMADKAIDRKVLAIVQFGPATPESGYRAGVYYQATIDPNMVSPSGEFLRFGLYPGDELNGWCLISGMTVADILCEQEATLANPPSGYTEVPGAYVVMRCVDGRDSGDLTARFAKALPKE